MYACMRISRLVSVELRSEGPLSRWHGFQRSDGCIEVFNEEDGQGRAGQNRALVLSAEGPLSSGSEVQASKPQGLFLDRRLRASL